MSYKCKHRWGCLGLLVELTLQLTVAIVGPGSQLMNLQCINRINQFKTEQLATSAELMSNS